MLNKLDLIVKMGENGGMPNQELQFEIKPDKPTSIVIWFAVFFVAFGILSAISFRMDDISSSDIVISLHQPIFWLFLLLVSSPFLLMFLKKIFRYLTLDRYNSTYVFNSGGVRRIIKENGKQLFHPWAEVKSYQLINSSYIAQNVRKKYDAPFYHYILLRGNSSSPTFFQNILFNIPVPPETVQNVDELLRAKGIPREDTEGGAASYFWHGGH